MAIAVIQDFEGGTPEQYDEVIKAMGFSPGGPGTPGCIFHWITRTDTGTRITDVWESREQFERFAAEEIAPKAQAAGVPGPPRITFYDVHNYLTAV
jgi:hypothetical protein